MQILTLPEQNPSFTSSKFGARKWITVHCTVGFIAVVMTVINTIASVAVRNTFAVATGERVGSALHRGGLVGRVLNTSLLVWRQLHAVRAATHSL